MASIWKRGGRSGKGGYYITVSDRSAGQTVRRTLHSDTTDKSAATEIGNKVEKFLACRAAHRQPDEVIARWLRTMPSKLRRQLVKAGVLQGAHAAEDRPLSFHLIGYLHAMKAKGNSPKTMSVNITRIGALLRRWEMHRLSDITAERVDEYLTERRIAKRGISAKTANDYAQAVKGFCNWLVKAGRLDSSPLDGLAPLPVVEEETRWPLSIEEMRVLLSVTASGPVRMKMSGVERALLYRLAVETGYRAGELASLTRANFDLERETPTVRCLAASSKGKRRSSIPLRPETAAMLGRHLAIKAPAALAFNMPQSTHTAAMVRADLIEARIPITDDLGRKRDFHALRHTCGTWLADAGVHPKVIQTIMRHSTIRLTMDRYAHSDRDQATDALGRMPSLSEQAQQATGTDDAPVIPTRSADNSAPVAPKATSGAPIGAISSNSSETVDSATPTQSGSYEPSEASDKQWAEQDSNLRRLSPVGLQPTPFGRSGIRPSGRATLSGRPRAGKRLGVPAGCRDRIRGGGGVERADL